MNNEIPEQNTFLDIKYKDNWHVGCYFGVDKWKVFKSFDDVEQPSEHLKDSEIQEWCYFNSK